MSTRQLSERFGRGFWDRGFRWGVREREPRPWAGPGGRPPPWGELHIGFWVLASWPGFWPGAHLPGGYGAGWVRWGAPWTGPGDHCGRGPSKGGEEYANLDMGVVGLSWGPRGGISGGRGTGGFEWGGTLGGAHPPGTIMGDTPSPGGWIMGRWVLASSLAGLALRPGGSPFRGHRGRGFRRGAVQIKPTPWKPSGQSPPRWGGRQGGLNLGVVVPPKAGRGGSGLGGRPLRARPKDQPRDFMIFQTTKSHEKTEMSLRISQLGHFLYGVLVVHGPPPYKNCPPQHFLATFTAVCIFTSQMGSVGLCRSEPGRTVRARGIGARHSGCVVLCEACRAAGDLAVGALAG